MMTKIKSFISKSNARLTALSFAVAGSLLAGSKVFAAVDPDVAATTDIVVTSMKDNIVGVITANIANIVIVGVIIFSISFVWKLSRRFMK
jgi:hypothetical protein